MSIFISKEARKARRAAQLTLQGPKIVRRKIPLEEYQERAWGARARADMTWMLSLKRRR